MRKLLPVLIVLSLLINWMPTSAEAAAPTVTITPPSGTQTAAFDVTITFSENVTGFTSSDIGLTNGASVTSLTGSDASYTATIKPKVTGNITISVGANVATNTGGEGNTAATDQTVSVDLPHQIMVMEPDGDGPYKAAFDVKVMFTEGVASSGDGAFVADDITLTPSTLATVTSVTGSSPTYTATITPVSGQEGSLSIQIAAGRVTDDASTPVDYPASNTVSVEIDAVRPQVSSITGPSGAQNEDFEVTITFDEDVNNFDPGDLTVSGDASAPSRWSSGSDGDDAYTGTIDISGVSSGNSNDVTISVGSNVAEDDADNGNSASASSVDLTVTVDNQKPTPTIGSVTGTKNAAFTINITFDEDVSNFAATDISLSKQSGTAGGTVSSVTGSGTTYSATIAPSGEGTLRISIPAGGATDGAGNTSTASSNVDVTVDTEGPTPTITAPTTLQNGDFNVTINFGETVTGFLLNDITLSGTAQVGDKDLRIGSASSVLTLSPNTSGTVILDIAANVVTDAHGNGNKAAAQVTVTVDKDAPTPTITAPTTPQNGPFNVTIDFGEPVYGFVFGDVILTGLPYPPNKFTSGAEGSQSYTIAITPRDGIDGLLAVFVPAGVATDAAGNSNTARGGGSTVDTRIPKVSTFDVPTGEKNSAFEITINFSEDVTDLEADDLTVTGPATAEMKSGTQGPEAFTVVLTPTANREGDVTLKVDAGAVTDKAGNGNAVSDATDAVHVDTIKPTPTITAPTTPQNGAFDVTIDFGETVTGFAKSDITIGGTATRTVGSLTGSGASYTLPITPSTSGTITIDVAANVAKDSANNNNRAATRASVATDTDAPVATITAPTTEQNGAFDVTVDFGENVTGFAADDLTATGFPGTKVLKSGTSGSQRYTLTLTPASTENDINVLMYVAADKVMDTAGNNNLISAEFATVRLDTERPRVLSITGVPTTDQKAAFDLTITFHEDVTGFAKGDLTVTGEAKATSVSGGPKVYTATITPNANKEGDVTVKVKADTVTDTAGNSNTASAATGNIRIDTIRPTPTITAPTTPQNGLFNVTIDFGETVTGFAKSDITIGGTATRTVGSLTGSGASYTLPITPSTSGTITIDVAANVAKDSANNNNRAATRASVATDTDAPMATITAPTTPQNGAFDVTVDFNEDVSNFVVGDLTVSGATKASNWKSGEAGPQTYTITLTPTAAADAEGTVTIDVPANVATDAATNGNTAATQASVSVDKKRPTVTITDIPTTEQKDPFNLTITFSEDVEGFAKEDLTVNGQAAATAVAAVGTSKTNYTATITPNANWEGDITVRVRGNIATDAAGNTNRTSGDSSSIHIDTIVPTVSSISGVPTTEQNAAFDLTVTFSEAVNGFAVPGDLTVTGPGAATLKAGSDGDSVYTVTVTPTATSEGDVTVKVNASTVTDNAGNSNTASAATSNIHIDTIVPTVSVTGLSTEQKGAFDLTVTFSEDVTGFATEDLTVTGEATVTSVSGSGSSWTATITPNAAKEGDVTVTVNASTVIDAAGNGNTAGSNTITVHIDTIKPTVAISGVPAGEQKGAFDLTVTFSEDVTGFATGDLTVTGEATATAVAAVGASKKEYTATITPNAAKEGDVTVTVNANTVIDAAGNGNTVSAATSNIHIDTIVPTVSSISGVPTTEQNAAFDLTVTFSEAVNGFAVPGDLTVTGPGAATLKAGSDGDSVYTVTVTPTATSEGDVTVKVDASTVTDNAGNANTASVATGNIHIDTIVPTVAIAGLSGEQKGAFDLTVTFSEDVTGFATEDLTVTGEATVTSVSGSGSSWTATITPNAAKEGDVTVTVNASTVIDAAGNGNTAGSNTVTVHIDTIKPTVAISDVPSSEQKDAFTLTITFSEDVTGFETGDLTVTGEATATLVSGGPKVYTATITPNANKEGDVTVKVNADTVIDAAGNNNTASAVTSSVHIDTIVPTVAISGVPTTEQNAAFDLTITFSEVVTGFATGDLTVTGEATATSVSGSGSSYTATITPNTAKEGDVTVTVNANTVIDAAGNANTASAATDDIHIDTIVPTVEIAGLSGEQKGAFDLTVTFSEAVNGFAVPGDLTVAGPGAATLKSGSDGDAEYTVTVTPDATSEGDVAVTVNASTVQDLATNANTAGSNTVTVHIDTIVPTVEISDVPSAEQKDAFTLTITFSEDVTGFETGDLTVTGEATATSVSGSGSDWTATITPNANKEGDVTVKVNADTVIDAAGNNNTASAATGNIHIDTIVPTVAISNVPSAEQNAAFDLTIMFNEAVSGFAVPGDLTVTGPGAATLKSGSDGDSVYTVTVTPSATSEGDVTVKVDASTVTDNAGNSNTASAATSNIHIDTIVPTVAIEDVPDIEKNVPYDLTVRFSEAVNGFAVPADLTVTGPGTAVLKSGSTGDAVYTVTITPDATSEGDVAVAVNANTVQDMATNANTAGSNTATVHVDTIVPTVSVSGFPTIEKNVPYDLTVTFSEEVNGFAADDLTLTGPARASLASGTDGDEEYTITITPNANAEGDVTVTVNASTVQDFARNNNTASTETTSVHVDTIIPTVSLSGFPPATPERNGPFTLTATFSEEVNGFAVPADLTVTGPATASLASGAEGDTVYTVTITPNANAEGDVTVTVNANSVQDFARNDNTASPETTSVHVDTIPPTVSVAVTPPTVTSDDGYETEERNEPYLLTVTFSEEVNGFALSDLAVTGPGSAALTSGSAWDEVYTVTVTPNADTEGDVRVTVNASTVQDRATNPNSASAPVTVHIDTIAPTFTIEDTPVLQRRNDFFDIRVVFSEEVNDFRPTDFTPSDLVTPSLQAGADGASEYIVRMTPNEDVQGDLFIEVNAETVRDLAHNLNADSEATTQPVRIDTIAPTVEITDLPTGVEAEPFDVTISFTEAVNGFTTEDIALVGPATVRLTAGTDGDAVYTVRVTPNPNANGNVTLQIPAAVVQDLSNNDNVASDLTDPIPIDTNALTVEVKDVPATVQLNAFSLTIGFSSDVEGFVLGDIEITGDAVVQDLSLLGSGSTYALTITPDENTDGDVIITVPAGVAQDAAGKPNAASVPQTVSVAPGWMPDASLRDAFRERLNLSPGEDFTQQQLRTVPTLELEAGQVRDVTGLEQAIALTTLDLSGQEITDLSPLRRLTQLTTLNLADNAITDLTPLSSLTGLTSLNLGGNGLTDIAALEDLTSLTTLDLSNNALTDISLLENLAELTALNLSGNRITDISPLMALTNLATLNLNDNPIANFTPLAGLTALTTLELGGTGLSSLNVVSGLTGLTSLNLRDNSLTDIALLANLTSLTVLNLNDNAVIDITPLSSLTRLTTLALADNAITTLTPLTALTVLTYLNLADNSITDVAPLGGLVNLETLRLAGNPILNTAPLYPLTQGVPSVDIDIEVSQYPPWDVNEDGTVDAADSALVTAALGQAGNAIENPRTDVNGDGTVDNADLTLVTANLSGVAGAPTTQNLLSQLDAKTLGTLDRETLETYLHQLRVESDGSLKYRNAIAMLEGLLAALRPTETRLLANYPNPFNPETWLPYELAVDSDVEIFIYNARGVLVRHLKLGHQPAGYYVAKSRAAYWDGRNRHGERVSSGVYFYQLRAGDISHLRKMVILK